MRRLGLALLALALAACTTSLQRGERLYRDGDRLGALEVWRAAPDDDDQHAALAKRIEEVEEEFDRLVVQFKKRARDFEGKDRLAESILDYRLALKLRPDPEVLSRVQGLARDLAARKTELKSTYGDAMVRNDLASARGDLARLRVLDAFDPELENDQRQLDAALRAEISRLLAAGRAAISRRDYKAAEDAFNRVLALDPQNKSAPADIRADQFYIQGREHEDNGESVTAIRYYLLALEANAGHKQAEEHLAAVRASERYTVNQLLDAGRRKFGNEDLQGALDLWGRARLIDPDNERARAYVARAQRQLQNLEQLRSEPDVSEGGFE